MLSPSHEDEDEEDNHLCIKCNSTIIGLDNYIKHRKSLCPKLIVRKSDSVKNEDTEVIPIPSLESIDPNLGADVFFQSLELQSSSKKNTQRITPPLCGGKTLSGAETRRHTSLMTVAPSSSNVARVSPVESKHRGSDWIGGLSLRLSSNADNETKLINAVASISGHAKKFTHHSHYELYEEDSNDESDDFDDIEDEDQHLSAKWKPPPTHTGGKWKPDSREWSDHQGPAADIDEWDSREEHTGGKWKTTMLTPKLEDEEDIFAPPPSHTKGKWVPGAKDLKQDNKSLIMQNAIQTKGSVQYWCGPCNRKLASRKVYEKHLLTNLHLKKICLENDLEYSGHIETLPIEFEKRTSRPSHYMDGSVYTQLNPKRPNQTDANKKVRKRRKIFTSCPGCKSRVKCSLMGKHLISHFHFRRTTVSGECYSDLIMANMEKIVHQSPFQCSPCKFYTNRKNFFTEHWNSSSHKVKVDALSGRYWCSFCKFECDETEMMLQHLTSSDHEEVEAVINRSMPIIIRKKSILRCEECLQEFRYNFELKNHSKKSNHALPLSATENYQEIKKCDKCDLKFKSSITLASHLKRVHKQKGLMCLLCSLTFPSSIEAKKHRNSSEHRIKRAEIFKERGLKISELKRKCYYCKQESENTKELKKHIDKFHPEMKPRCSKCGTKFTLPQEVTQHVRKNLCDIRIVEGDSNRWHCSQCLYSTDSEAECYFHEVLHNPPFQYIYTDRGVEKSVLKYKCPLCTQMFTKFTLRGHLRQHTSEKPFKCSHKDCKAEFARWTSAVNHQKITHRIRVKSEEQFTCSICEKNFPTNPRLQRHLMVHDTTKRLACDHAGCVYTARTEGELKTHVLAAHNTLRRHACDARGCDYAAKTIHQLKRHRRLHMKIRKLQHACNQCSYRTDQASHLKTHLRQHEGSKPYHCPYCTTASSSLENLRKHILNYSTHRGLPIYMCKECPKDSDDFITNLATELRTHLVSSHGDKFERITAVRYVAEYFFVK